jgi:hypothetical protein
MRVALRIVVLLLMLLAVAAPAGAGVRKCVADPESPTGYRCRIVEEDTPPRVSSRPRPPRPEEPPYLFRELWRPVLREDADGATCVDTETVRLGRDPFPAEDMHSEMQFFRFLRSYGICQDAELPVTTPAMEAASFVRQISLPLPLPYVQPDALPVGFEAFLETGAPTSQTFGPVDTPFGPLTLTATAQIYVDWDDPYDDVDGEHGPYTGQPGPHPDGEITHVYQHHGTYDIAVRYVWTANWSIGDTTGTIEGVETSGSYPDPGFEAYSREAVGR